MGAGTDSKVFISFNGERNKIAKHAFIKPESGKNPFEKKSKDVFKFNEIDVGKVRSVSFHTPTDVDRLVRSSSKPSLWNMMEPASVKAGIWTTSKSNSTDKHTCARLPDEIASCLIGPSS